MYGVGSSCVCFIDVCLLGGGFAWFGSIVFLLGCGCCGEGWDKACVYFFIALSNCTVRRHYSNCNWTEGSFILKESP